MKPNNLKRQTACALVMLLSAVAVGIPAAHAAEPESPDAITPHRTNYILPVSWTNRPNGAPFGISDTVLDNWEVKFQMSLKVAVWERIANRDISLFFAYTACSWWQAYNSLKSSPFRDTNHEPELFLRARWPQRGELGPLSSLYGRIGINHESNGQPLPISRSWNRIIAGIEFNIGSLRMDVSAWKRLPEEDKDDPSDARGDDNPQITDYVGRSQVSLLYPDGRLTYSLTLRNNLRLDERNRGSMRFALFFPINSRLQGYAEFFNGYGESLIDYDASGERISLGVALNTWP